MKNVYTRRSFLRVMGTASILTGLTPTAFADDERKDRPNILWITSEDNSPLLGCYGDKFATTPALDKLASEGVLYENALANAPVCAPTRFTILTGMYACSMGTHHMRSRYEIPDSVRPYPYYLRQAGYYCTNPGKTDYNFKTNDKSHWDKGTYKNRKSGQPFFHVENITISHESSIHKTSPKTIHDTAKVPLPPYHPDTPEMRHDWAQYYDQVTAMDSRVGKILDQLEKDGLAEDTIVFYYSDHGGVVGRSKRFLYDSGTHVPFIVRFPKKYQHLASGKPGTRTDRIISFVDLAPTLLSLAGVNIPAYIQGKAFLGDRQAKSRDYAYMFRGRMDERYDMVRSVRDKKYRYIRNYMPHRIYGLRLEYLWKAPSMRSWERAFRTGKCNPAQSIFWGPKPAEELYDVTVDPHEINNLADDPGLKDVLERMRKANMRWVREIRDAGFIPEGEMVNLAEKENIFEYIRNTGYPFDRVIETAETATDGDESKLPELINRLSDKCASVRYWAATSCVIMGEKARAALPSLKKLLQDTSADVRIAASEALFGLGETESALSVLYAEVKNKNPKVGLHAMNVLLIIGDKDRSFLESISRIAKTTKDNYIKKTAKSLIERLEE
ncbi:sulfatase-like hydrolase/transferase [Verrucomicrobiota bacterium]